MYMSGWSRDGNRRDSWGFLLREAMKVAVVISCSAIVSIPACSFIDDSYENYKCYKSQDVSSPRALLHGIRDSLLSFPYIGAFLTKLYFGRRMSVEKDQPLHYFPEYYAHDNFLCPISTMVLEDPVFLQGRPFSRTHITEWLNIKRENPLTRQRAVPSQISEPPPDFLECFYMYLAARAQVIVNSHLPRKAQ